MPGPASVPTPAPSLLLPTIVLAQFAGASIWFAGNAVLPDLEREWGLPASALGYVTSAVQLGFIAGTLAFAFLTIADRHSPRRVFLVCSVVGALANLAAVVIPGSLGALVATRFVAGFFLAGIYPVGMKIASGWYQRDLGKALGMLVGAVVLGTAFPHLLKSIGQAWPWQAVLTGVSTLAVLGGVLMHARVPDGPYLRQGAKFDPRALASVFHSPQFRASAFGYFGHMWELYAFWAFVPVVLASRPEIGNVPAWAFAVIAAGAVGCAGGGLVSQRAGSARVASTLLLISGTCCMISPLAYAAPTPVFLAFLLAWGVAVAGDSPQFSALNAAHAPPELVGSALTIANCVGFAITIFSIELLNTLATRLPVSWLFVLLAPGPVLGLIAMRPLIRRAPRRHTG